MNRKLISLISLMMLLGVSLIPTRAAADGADTVKHVYDSTFDRTEDCIRSQGEAHIRESWMVNPSGKHINNYHTEGWFRVEDICTGELHGFEDYKHVLKNHYKDGEIQVTIFKGRREVAGRWYEDGWESRMVYTFIKGELVNYFLWINGEKINLLDG